ncbi:undecaprenyl-phosphate glucose phosphotransferase [Burkholderia paludis]|uniref:undecaprenyl-phosphate glucose phosphotransferase n=1 Tax=Burkholderia paludis TaxID=1506587 RepID=UPI0006896830|nr:undecaprenyl-phosphate glucose phosphotransferase [Burkholderia paludis]
MHTTLAERRIEAPSAARGLLARLADVAFIAFGAALAAWMFPGNGSHRSVEMAAVASAAAFAMILFPAFGLYRAPYGRTTRRIAIVASGTWLLAQACSVILIVSLHGALLVPVSCFALWTATSGVALVASRLFVHRTLTRRHAGERLVAVVGTGPHGAAVLGRITQSPSGYRAAAMLDVAGASDAARDAHAAGDGMRRFHALDAFAEHVRSHAIPEVWIALPIADVRGVESVLDAFRHDLVNIRFMPDVSRLAMFDAEMVDLVGAPAFNLVASPLPPHALTQKALFDRLFAAAALLGTAPLLLAIAAAVRLSSPGPVLFRQRRKGADGKTFTIYKFRTMRVHAATAGSVQQATRDDPRVTRVGAFLRRTSLDELPQFINVLRGDMSVVGPRPHAIEHDNLYQTVVDGYIHRYRVKPGITGWAQINGLRGETDRIEKMQRRIEADLYYLRNWSFGLDMRIVFATATHGWIHRNAY